MKSNVKVDEDAVKKFNEESVDWIAHCKICGRTISGTLTQIRAHRECHGTQGK